MPLIDFRTNLTSLRYGGDKPGGGSSDQPFVQFPIDNDSTPPEFKRYYEANRTGLDFPVRGGAITQLLTGDLGIISSTIDRTRIERFFKSAPRGTAFIEKQKGLQLTNPRTQVPNTLAFAGDFLQNTFLPVTNVYNPANTLAQVQVMGTGAHFNRHGAVPTIVESVRRTYEYIAGAPENNTANTNRLAILRATKILYNNQFLPTDLSVDTTNIDLELVNRMGISQYRDQILNYPGGPGSVYGIGFTRVRRATDTGATTLLANQVTGFTVGGTEPNSKPYAYVALTYDQLAVQDTRPGGVAVKALVQDFRAQTNEDNPKIPFSDYKRFNIASIAKTNFGIGNPGAPKTQQNYNDTSNSDERIDQLNASNPFYYNSVFHDPWSSGQTVGAHTKDIIKFAFECINNNGVNGDNTLALIFRAFLEGQISDSNRATFNDFKYLGRGETFKTYQGFDRTVGFSFKVFVQSRQEMQPLFKKLNALMSQVYPDYSPNYNLMRGNVVRLTIGDYLYRVPGFLENVDITIDNGTTPWEVVLNQFYQTSTVETVETGAGNQGNVQRTVRGQAEDDVRQLPHMVTVQCTFKPIFDILPRAVNYENPYVPLVVNKPQDTYTEIQQIIAPKRGVATPSARERPQIRVPSQLPVAAPQIPIPTTG